MKQEFLKLKKKAYNALYKNTKNYLLLTSVGVSYNIHYKFIKVITPNKINIITYNTYKDFKNFLKSYNIKSLRDCVICTFKK